MRFLRWKERGRLGRAGLVAGMLGLLGLALAAVFAGYVYAMWRAAPELSELEQRENGENSTLYDADGERLGVVQADTLRTALEGDEIPRLVEEATIAAEDRRFRSHEGVDFQGVLRAAVENVRAGEVVEGGSTLTQQVVRNLYIGDQQTLARKVKEAKLASQMEDRISKERILTLYLNNVPYGTVQGQSAVGIQAAARTFFAKPVDELELHEAALLAGLPRAPAAYQPFENEEPARRRRQQVLDAMAETGVISRQQAREAAARPLGVERGEFYSDRDERYFFDFVEQELIERYGERRVRRGGLDVYTTVREELQEEARKAIRRLLDREDDPAAAVVSIEPGSGRIETMVTSERFRDLEFNLAVQSRRQPGSAIKPVVLMAALREGVDPERTTYASRPLDIQTPRFGSIEVRNFAGRYRGEIDLERATVTSDNAVFQQLALDLGPEQVAEEANRIGLSDALSGLPAEALGGLERGVSPLAVARAYATLASGGERTRPYAIERVVFPSGAEVRTTKPEPERVYERDLARRATQILARNVRSGTGTQARIGCPAAGKTGTTRDFTDAWFAGYTPGLSTAVWVGYPEPRPMRDIHGIDVSGSTFPARIWGRYMASAVDEDDCAPFPRPDGDELDLEPYCGDRATTPACEEDDEEERSARDGGSSGDGGSSADAGSGDDSSAGGSSSGGGGRSSAGGGSSDRGGDSPDEPNTSGGGPSDRGGSGGGGSSGEGGGSGGDGSSGVPDTRIDSSPPARTQRRSGEFRFSSPGGGAERFECALDDRAFSACSSPRRVSGLDNGRHTFRVRAIGPGGRRDPSPAVFGWVVRPGPGS